MKRCLLLALALATALVPSLSLCSEAAESDVRMYVLSVGKADAILLSVDGHTVLIDTGYDYSAGRIRAGLAEMGVTSLEAVFITHLDNDHIGGLTWLAESDIDIGTWYASGMYMDVDSPEDHPVVQAAAVRGQEAVFLLAGDEVSLGSAVLKVLSPLVQATDKDDNNSLVMMLESSEGRILLAGDMEYPAEKLLLASGCDLNCDVLKVANHADDDTNSPAFTQAASPQIAVISTSTAEKPETPDAEVVRSLKNAGAEVYVTQECTGGILVRLKGGYASAERIDVAEAGTEVDLVSAEPGTNLITLSSGGAEAVDLSGWYLYSTRGGEMYFFPEGTVIEAGGTLTAGTKTSPEGSYDLFWNDKKVVHQKKEDSILLYNASGTVVSTVSNGL